MRRKVTLPGSQIESRDEADAMLGTLAGLQTQIDALTAEMDQRIQAVRQEYEHRINRLSDAMDPITTSLQLWAEGEKESWPTKSIELVHGKLGFRTGTPCVKLLHGVKESAALDMIRQSAIWAARYIRTRDEINREALIADRADLPAESQRAMGLRIAQSETFFIEPKHEQPLEQ